jgi:hypothetical protein
MSWLMQYGDRLAPRIREFFLLWLEGYGPVSPLPNFSGTEHKQVQASCLSLEEQIPDPGAVRLRSGRHLTLVPNPLTAHPEQLTAGLDRQFTESPTALRYKGARHRRTASPRWPVPAAVRPKKRPTSKRGGPSRGRNAPQGHASPYREPDRSDKLYSHFRANIFLRQPIGRLLGSTKEK